MGGGSFDSAKYYSEATSRKVKGVDDFAYSHASSTVHDTLKASRISGKAFSVLESRDSVEHPHSTAIIVCLDVTGSNASRARDAQKSLPGLMTLLKKYVKDPQIAIAANDDFTTSYDMAFQMSEFESDNRVDDHIRNLKLVSKGGGNDAESYDLMLYAAAYKTVTDCFEKRGKKGYLFMYADEPFFQNLDPSHVKGTFGDVIDDSVPMTTLVAKAKEKWEIFLLFPVGGYAHAHEQYIKLFGSEFVITIEHPNKLAEVIGATIGVYEGEADTDSVVTDLASVGVDAHSAQSISRSLSAISVKRAIGKTKSGTMEVGGSGANRL